MSVSPLMVNFVFAPSRMASGLLLAGLLPIVISLFIIPIPAAIPLAPLVIQMPLAAAIVFAFYRAHKKLARLRASDSLHGLRWITDAQIAILNREQEAISDAVLLGCFISPTLTTLRLRVEINESQHKTYTALILPDSLPARHFHHLRLRLKQMSLQEETEATQARTSPHPPR